MRPKQNMTRRRFLEACTASAAIGVAIPGCKPRPASSQSNSIELVHWSWMSASDGEVWGQMINAFNEAHKDSGVSIRSEVLPYDQYVTKVLVSSVTGQAPDFGWGDAGTRASMVKEDVVIPLDELATQVGLDFEDFDEALLETMRYRKYSDRIYGVPMDAMSMQSEHRHPIEDFGIDTSD